LSECILEALHIEVTTMRDESDKKNSQNKLEICGFCSGSGKVCLTYDDNTGTGRRNVVKLVCPVCRGRGKARRRSRPVRMGFKLQRRNFLPGRPTSGRHGRLSHGLTILPPAGTPLAGWPEGDLVPKSTPESEYAGLDVDPAEAPDDPELRQRTVLRLSDDQTIVVSPEFAPGVVLDATSVQTNFEEPFEVDSEVITAQVLYDLGSSEHLRAFLDLVQPHVELPFEHLDGVAGISGQGGLLSAEPPEIDLSGYDSGLSADIAESALDEVTVPLHRHMSATHTNVLSPNLHGPASALDVVGFSDPVGFEINTDVTGQVGL
jgi:hypothetical protein